MTNIQPHGGQLIDRFVATGERDEALVRAGSLRSIEIDSRAASDLLLLASGAFSPLRGFTGYEATKSIVENATLPDGTLWPLPTLLQVHASLTDWELVGQEVALVFRGEILGTINVDEVFSTAHDSWIREIFWTTDLAHPGVEAFLSGGRVAIAGEVTWLGDPAHVTGFGWQSPTATRTEIARFGWKTVAGFQTRNPIHRAHEYVLRTALELIDGLLLHPLVGDTRGEDVPAGVRIRCYEELLNYLPADRVLFALFPGWMRYAGPREALFHALVRKNYGCTHFLVGRDHAGVGSYYGPYDAQNLLRSVSGPALGITPLFFDEVFHCSACKSMASRRTCPHGDEFLLKLSGTEVRRRLRDGLDLPEEFTRPEVAAILAEAYALSD